MTRRFFPANDDVDGEVEVGAADVLGFEHPGTPSAADRANTRDVTRSSMRGSLPEVLQVVGAATMRGDDGGVIVRACVR
jgi:hypothetical protein